MITVGTVGPVLGRGVHPRAHLCRACKTNVSCVDGRRRVLVDLKIEAYPRDVF